MSQHEMRCKKLLVLGIKISFFNKLIWFALSQKFLILLFQSLLRVNWNKNTSKRSRRFNGSRAHENESDHGVNHANRKEPCGYLFLLLLLLLWWGTLFLCMEVASTSLVVIWWVIYLSFCRVNIYQDIHVEEGMGEGSHRRGGGKEDGSRDHRHGRGSCIQEGEWDGCW